MDKYNEIVQKITQIIDLCNLAGVYISVSSCVSKTLNDIRERITNLTTKTENEALDSILEQLNELYNIVESFNMDKWAQTSLQTPVFKPITDIIEIMDSITELLIKIGITLDENFDTPIDQISDDLNSIYGILANPDKLDDPAVKSKLEEIIEQLNGIGRPLISAQPQKTDESNSNNSDIFEETTDFNDIQKYQLKASDIKYDEPPFDEPYSIVKGQMKGIKSAITVTIFNSENFGIEKFKRFVNVHAAVNHDNVEKFIGSVENPPPFIVVTQAKGENLSTMLKRQNRHKIRQQVDKGEIPDDVLLYNNDDDNEDGDYEKVDIKCGYKTIIAFQIASAMAYLHSINIMHRDLCTENVTVDREFNARVTNFVNSRYIPNNFSSVTILSSKLKHPFKAPELSNPDGYTRKVDVFAFGGILYELLTDKPPFNGKDSDEIGWLIDCDNRPDIPLEEGDDLRKLIESCWLKPPDDRPSFATIIDTMIAKSISFPCDRDSEITKQFYASKKVKNDDFKICLEIIKKILETINESFMYKQETFRIRTLLYGYLFLLETSEYARLPNIENANVKTQLLNIKTYLQALQSTLNQTKKKEWLSIYLTTESLKIPKDMRDIMEQIYISMNQLGFNVIKYKFVKCDLQSDLRDVYNYLEGEEQSIEVNGRINDIKKFMYENGMNLYIDKEEINSSIKTLLEFCPEYEVDRNDFNIEYEIGMGISSTVMKGTQKSTGQSVAIKEFKNEYFEDIKMPQILRREIAFLMELKNEYLVEFIGFNIDENKPVWIVMKYIEGGSLADVLNNTDLDSYQKTKIAFEVAQGMEYLNKHNVMHRDLKSANILLEDPEHRIVKPHICDFGYARNDSFYPKYMTFETGTVNYRAPEIISKKPYNFKADVFSFGNVLFELYANSCPYYWLDTRYIEDYIKNNEPLIYDEKINEDLKQLIEDCTNYDPDKRPTFTEIIERMIKDEICYNDILDDDKDDIIEFYQNKKEERKNMNNSNK